MKNNFWSNQTCTNHFYVWNQQSPKNQFREILECTLDDEGVFNRSRHLSAPSKHHQFSWNQLLQSLFLEQKANVFCSIHRGGGTQRITWGTCSFSRTLAPIMRYTSEKRFFWFSKINPHYDVGLQIEDETGTEHGCPAPLGERPIMEALLTCFHCCCFY